MYFGARLRGKKIMSCLSQAKPFFICCVSARARERVLMTQKVCALGIRNATQRNRVKEARKGFRCTRACNLHTP